MSRRRRHRLKLKSLYVWHRWLGLFAALFVIVLAATGLALNHTETLRLDERHVQNGWLLEWYGIAPPDEVAAWRAGEHWISQWERRLFLDRRDLGEFDDGPLRGAVQSGELLLVALRDSLLLLTPDGELVDRLTEASLPGRLQAIGLDAQQRPVLITDRGRFVGDADLVSWQPTDAPLRHRAQPATLPAPLADALARQWRGRGLTLERVMLDLHSGRIFGQAGVWLMDAAAIVMLFLALSGSGIWLVLQFRRRRRGPGHRHGQGPTQRRK